MEKSELLRMFCAKGDIRKYMNNPIRRDGFLYAVNGWLGIRIPDDTSVEAVETSELPRIQQMFEHDNVEFHPLPLLADPVKCKKCSGTGVVYVENCPDCDGDGCFTHGNHVYDCKECDGSGEVEADDQEKAKPCWHCSGMGESDHRGGGGTTQIGGLTFQNFLLRNVTKLPNARIEHVIPADPERKDLPYAHFIFEGGEGVIMPYRV